MSGQVIDSLLRNLDRVRADLNERTAELNQATDRLAKLAKLLEQAYQDLGEAQRCRVEETAKLQQQVEKLQKDKDRLDWLESRKFTERLEVIVYSDRSVGLYLDNNSIHAYGTAKGLRFCIDAAARKEAE